MVGRGPSSAAARVIAVAIVGVAAAFLLTRGVGAPFVDTLDALDGHLDENFHRSLVHIQGALLQA